MFAPAGLSIFAEMTALAQRYGALNLAQGFPEFGPDPELIAAFHRALDVESAQYAPMPGLLRLREAVAAGFGVGIVAEVYCGGDSFLE